MKTNKNRANRVKKGFFAIVIVATLVFCLSGCAQIFDALNFTKETLPNLESEVEQGLTNPFPTQSGGLSENEFIAIESATKTLMNGSRSENIVFSLDSSYGTMDIKCNLKTVDNQTDDTKAISAVSIGYTGEQPNNQNTTFIYEDYICFDGNKYIVGDFFKYFSLPAYDFAKDGSYILGIMSAIRANFGGFAVEWINGREFYETTFSGEAAVAIAEATRIESSNILPDTEECDQARVTFEKTTTIEQLSIALSFGETNISISCKLSDYDFGAINHTLPTFEPSYLVTYAIDSIIQTTINGGKDYVARVSTSEKDGSSDAETSSATLYNQMEEIEVKYIYPDHQFSNYYNSTIKVLEFSGETYYSSDMIYKLVGDQLVLFESEGNEIEYYKVYQNFYHPNFSYYMRSVEPVIVEEDDVIKIVFERDDSNENYTDKLYLEFVVDTQTMLITGYSEKLENGIVDSLYVRNYTVELGYDERVTIPKALLQVVYDYR